MLSRTQALRWSGKSISNGRQRLANSRQLSSNALRHTNILRASGCSKAVLRSPRIQQQCRSISLLGWGASSKPSPERPLPTSPSNPSYPEPSSNSNILESSRTIKASHATSDAADPSTIQEPGFLKNLEDSIANPQGFEPDKLAELDIASIPERAGYLKEVCGIDFGYGTTSIFQWLAEELHLYTGFGWAASFTILLVLGRLLLFRTALRGQEMAYKIKELNPILNPLREEYKASVASGDKLKMQTTANQIRAITRDSGVSMMAAFKPVIYQIPLSLGGYRLGHAMSAVPVPSVETETFFWFTNLAIPDPWILPCLTAALSFIAISRNIRVAAAAGPVGQFQNLLKWALPSVSFVFVMWQPGIVQIFFAGQAVLTCIQISAFTSVGARRYLGLPPLTGPDSSTGMYYPTPSSTSTSNTAQPQNSTIAGMTLNTTSRPATTSSSTSSSTTTTTTDPYNATTEPAQNISFIDKAVNSIKSRKDNVTKSLYSSKPVAKQQKKHDDARAEKYEYKRRQDEKAERDWRNKQLREKGTNKNAE